MFGTRVTEKVLIERLQNEVDYLREQNKLLLDRNLALIDQKNYEIMKRHEASEKQQQFEIDRELSKTPEQRAQELESKKDDEQKQKVFNAQMAQMMRGE